MLSASCHCGAVRIELSRKPRALTECTCSICRRYGAQWAYCTRKTARVFCARDAVAVYSWGKKSLEFYHCRTCGCLTHYENRDKSINGRIAVNARMLAPEDVAGIKINLRRGRYLEVPEVSRPKTVTVTV